MKYLPGQIVIYLRCGEPFEQEVWKVRHDFGSYYHMVNDDKIYEDQIIGVVERDRNEN